MKKVKGREIKLTVKKKRNRKGKGAYVGNESRMKTKKKICEKKRSLGFQDLRR